MIVRVASTLALLMSSVSSFAPRSLAYGTRVKWSALFSTKVPSGTDYANQIDRLSTLLDSTRENLATLKDMAAGLMDMEIQDPHLSDIGSGDDAEALRRAVAEAKAACDAFGNSSAEAMVAWEEVDAAAAHHAKEQSHQSFRYSAAALEAHHNYDAVVDTQLLSDSISALDTIEALSHFVNVERKRLEENNAFQ